jgi:hypothetical protein
MSRINKYDKAVQEVWMFYGAKDKSKTRLLPNREMVMSSIFVQIPAYHDLELSRTIKDCLKKSSGKHVINFGIHLSYFKNNDIDIPILNNIKFSTSLAPKNIGVGMGRYLANEFYNGEDYYLQIDSHMRFGEFWDDILINNYLKYKSMGANPAISAYPGAYEYDGFNLNILNTKSHVTYTDFIKELSFQDNYVPHQRAVANFENNIFSRSVSAASIFSSGEIASIKPNKNMFFWGEEILTAIRLYTHGFDIMLPEAQFFYHLYYDLMESPTCKGCGEEVAFNGFYNGYGQFCHETACQWLDEEQKNKKLNAIAKTVNNKRIENNLGKYSYINF